MTSYDAVIQRSGIFLNIAVPENGLMAKLADGGAFVEVVTMTDQVYTSFGNCSAN